MIIIYRSITAAVLLGIASISPLSGDNASIPTKSGTLIYHSYSSYTAMDSSISLFDLASGSSYALSEGDYIHAMNADFGSHPYDVTFMAIDPVHDEWDIYRCNILTNELVNLTSASGFRNEDPKFSPDGLKIVFKRGHWDSGLDNFVYDLAEIDLRTNTITMLTDDTYEESMPYYSADGSKIFYARSSGEGSDIYMLDRNKLESYPVYSEEGVYSYYPVTSGDELYFVKWHSSDNKNDCIVHFNDDNAQILPFCDASYNCSDPFVSGDDIFFSSTSGGSYDLYFSSGTDIFGLDMLNTELNELGAAFFSFDEALLAANAASDQILGISEADINTDADGSGNVSCMDLIALRRKLLTSDN